MHVWTWKDFERFPEYYEDLCFGVYNDVMENDKKITMEEDEDE